jgi:hypothetical protein
MLLQGSSILPIRRLLDRAGSIAQAVTGGRPG